MENHKINLHQVQEFLLDLLPRAGQIVRRYFLAEILPKKRKGKLDFVTAADLATDEFLCGELKKIYPEIPILTEEKDPGENSFETLKDKELLWVVDPLDGTANFARGDANFSISVALVSHGKPQVGVLFAPVNSRLFWARTDHEGAYLNGRRIYVSKIDKLYEAVICTDWSHITETRDKTTNFLRMIYGTVRQIKILGSAATDISLLARGGVDIYHHVHLLPWDAAAASLIAWKAGAQVTDLDGGEWNVFTPGIIASNPILHKMILAVLNP